MRIKFVQTNTDPAMCYELDSHQLAKLLYAAEGQCGPGPDEWVLEVAHDAGKITAQCTGGHEFSAWVWGFLTGLRIEAQPIDLVKSAAKFNRLAEATGLSRGMGQSS